MINFKTLFLVIIYSLIASCDSDLQIDASHEVEKSRTANIDDPDQVKNIVLEAHMGFKDINPEFLCNDITLENEIGESIKGSRICNPEELDECKFDGELNCISNEKFRAADTSGLANKLLFGNIVGGVMGNYTPDFPSINNVLSTDTANGIQGNLNYCNKDSEIGCISNSNYLAINLSAVLPSNIKEGATIGSITGTLKGKPADCSANTEVGCVTTATYKAADLTNLTSGNIKKGVSIAGEAGDYPSVTNPLTGNTAAADLTAATMNAKLASATAFEFFDSAGNLQSSAGDADLVAGNIQSGNTIFGVAGSVTASPADCSSNTEVGCVTTATYKAADLTNLTAGNIKNGVSIAGEAGDYPSATNPLTGNTAAADLTAATMNAKLASATAFEFFDSAGNLQSSAGDADLVSGNIESDNTIFGVAGSVTASPADCSSNSEVGCVTTATYKAADLTNLTAGNIKNGVSIAGEAGDYPSATNPLTGNTAAADLTAATMNAKLASATAFEFFDSAGNLQSSAGDADLVAGNIESGNTIFGVAGSVTASPADCSSNTEVGCVTTVTYKAADLTNLTAGNIKNGISIAGQAGDYPSATNPLTGNTAAADLTAATMNAKLASATSFEFFDSAGNLQSSAGDADLIAGNIESGNTIFGVAGSVTASPADCSSNSEVGCVTTATYKAADLTNLIAGNIKNGVSIAGQSGDYPSATNPLTGNTATADLTAATINAKLASATAFEFFDSAGNLQTSAGDSDLIIGNIKSGITFFGLTGSLSGSPANCSSNTEVGCVTTATYKAADLTNLTAGNIKNGVSIAGEAGDYPSATNPLTGNTATPDLTAATMNAKLASATAFEFFDSAGNLQSSAGDADLVAGNIESGNTIFGVAGSVTASPSDCTSNGQESCVTTSTYKAADLSNLTAGNIKNGVSIAGQGGNYPSASSPLAGNTATADLTAATMNAKLASATAFEFFDSEGSLQTFAGDADLVAGNIESGNTIFGVAGSVIPSPADCSSNTEVGCVTTASYKAADLTNLTAGNIKNGVSIAGQAGDYPSATNPLTGATATADLTQFTTQLTSEGAFEFWSSEGVKNTGSGDSDLVADKIKTGIQLENFGLTGTFTDIPDLEFKDIYTGTFHSCGLTSSGKSYCWGSNSFGQIGDGTIGTNRPSPVEVSTVLSFIGLTLGDFHTCGWLSSGEAYCWGRDLYGELGDGGANSDQSTPVAVIGSIKFTALEAGADHTCGLTSDGNAYCWGRDQDGQLGDGSGNIDQSSPSAVAGGYVFTMITSGTNQSCGLVSSGQAYCWGRDNYGKLGNGGSNDAETAPVAVSGGHEFKHIASGSTNVCGVKLDGQAYCWGQGTYGQIGNGSNSNQSTPVAVNGSISFTTIFMGANHVCGLSGTGSAYCWGRDTNGQLGNDIAIVDQSTPKAVAGGHSFIKIHASGLSHFTCGLLSTGEAYCWGLDSTGQLGDGSSLTNQAVPSAVIMTIP